MDCRNGTENPDVNGTLQAKSTGGMSLNLQNTIRDQLTVRRLTPTECARLQGFPDKWGSIPQISDMTDAEVDFWNDVDFTKRRIDGRLREHQDGWHIWTEKKKVWNDTGKQYKPMTKKQVIAWYNRLHTDSSEYKMWGNGVALPCVEFIMGRLAECGAKTVGSLFDGSGGFPLAGLMHGITPVWASEIEPYPIAVTRCRFGDD